VIERTDPARLPNKKTTALRRFSMQLAGLEPATSWVRSRRSWPKFGSITFVPSQRAGSPNTFPKTLQPVLQYDNARVAHEGSGRNSGLSRRGRGFEPVARLLECLEIGSSVA
jgi:hypothetical protein